MDLLLDESLPRRLVSLLVGHRTETVQERGWASITNGELLRLASEDFDALITADHNLPFQQNLQLHDIAVIVLAARTNRIEDWQPLIPGVLRALESIEPGAVVRVARPVDP